MGFFERLATLVFVQRTVDPLFTLEHGADVMGEIPILPDVPRRKSDLDCDVSADGIEVVRGAVVYLAFVIVNPSVVPQRMDEGSAITVREHDLAREGGAVGVALQCLQNATDVVRGDHIIVVHKGHVLPSRLRQKHVSLLSDGHLSTIGHHDELDFIVLLGIETGMELLQTALAIR